MKSKEDIVEQVNKTFAGSKERALRVSYVLSQLDLGLEENKAKFNLVSILRLLLFKIIKGITTYYQLSEYLVNHEDEAFQLGFYKDENNALELPPKRTFNNYLKDIDKKQLNEIAELILAAAVKNNIILDLNIVVKAIKEKNNHDKEVREVVKLIKKLVYPNIDLKIKSNGKFTTKDLLDVLVHVAFTHDFANEGAMTFKEINEVEKSPSGRLMMYHFSKFNSINKIRKMFERISEIIFNFARQNYNVLRNRKHDIAYDIHKVPYYGKGILWACGDKPERGTSQFIEFLTCSIVVAGRRFVVDVVPIHPLDDIYKLLDDSLARVKNKLKIERAYLDRGFNEVKIYRVLKKHKVKFLMPMTRYETIKAAMRKSEFCPSRIFHDFKIGRDNDFELVNLVLVDDEQGLKRAFVCNFDIAPCLAYRLYEMYGRRWGIETGYRQIDHDFKAKTTSRNYHIRLFYFLFSTCLYNLWVLVNICVSLTIYGRIKDKPVITAKMFAILLYKVRERYDSGG